MRALEPHFLVGALAPEVRILALPQRLKPMSRGSRQMQPSKPALSLSKGAAPP